jgi:hypothetical protein
MLPIIVVACADSGSVDGGLDAAPFPDVAQDTFFLDEPVLVDDGSTPDTSTGDARAADGGAIDSAIDVVTPDAAPIDATVDAHALTYPEVVRADSPLSYWRFGEASGTVATDEMGATNGTYTGTVTLGAAGAIVGDANTAASFDGSTGYVALGNGFGFTGTSPMTVEAWVKAGTLDASYRRFLSKETQDTNGRQGYTMASVASGGSGLLSFERFRDGQSDALAMTIPIGQYVHVVATYDGAAIVLYLNGVPNGSAASTRSLSSIAVPLHLATYSDPTLGPQEFFPGSIDELAIYGHALSAARVLVHYKVGTGM